jgi:hypothetical protein
VKQWKRIGSSLRSDIESGPQTEIEDSPQTEIEDSPQTEIEDSPQTEIGSSFHLALKINPIGQHNAPDSPRPWLPMWFLGMTRWRTRGYRTVGALSTEEE